MGRAVSGRGAADLGRPLAPQVSAGPARCAHVGAQRTEFQNLGAWVPRVRDVVAVRVCENGEADGGMYDWVFSTRETPGLLLRIAGPPPAMK